MVYFFWFLFSSHFFTLRVCLQRVSSCHYYLLLMSSFPSSSSSSTSPDIFSPFTLLPPLLPRLWWPRVLKRGWLLICSTAWARHADHCIYAHSSSALSFGNIEIASKHLKGFRHRVLPGFGYFSFVLPFSSSWHRRRDVILQDTPDVLHPTRPSAVSQSFKYVCEWI